MRLSKTLSGNSSFLKLDNSDFSPIKKEIQNEIEPLVISWGYESEMPSHSQFLDYHQWQGTNDPSSYLTIPDVINFLDKNKWNNVSKNCCKENRIARNKLNIFLNQSPISKDKFIGQMSSIKIPFLKNPMELQLKLYNDYQIQIPIFNWGEKTFLRISIQAYNTMEDIEKLIFAFKKIKNI